MFKRKDDIPHLDIPEATWMENIVTALDLKQGSYAILPVYGGALLYVIKEGLTWFPRSIIATLGSSPTPLAANKQIQKLGATIIDEVIPIPLYKISSAISKDLLKIPPDQPIYYIQRFIKHVEVVPKERYAEIFGFVDDKMRKDDEQESNETGALFIAEVVKEAEFITDLKGMMEEPKPQPIEDRTTMLSTAQSAISNLADHGKAMLEKTAGHLDRLKQNVITGRSNYYIFRYSNRDYMVHFVKALQKGGINVFKAGATQ